MKVKLKDLKPNPFRDFQNYPIQEEKVKSLEESIIDTGYWDQLVVRKNGDGFELVYGHHRLQALKNLIGEDTEIEVMVKDYGNEDMIRIMANENNAAYNATPATVDEAVKGTRDFLRDHPEEARQILSSEGSEVKRVRIGAPMISRFLGGNFNLTKIQESLARLKAIEEGVVSPEALYQFPTASSANNFVNAAKMHHVNKKVQEEIAKRLVTLGTIGRRTISEAMEINTRIENWENSNNGLSASYCDRCLRESIRLMDDVIKKLNRFQMQFGLITIFDGKTTIDDVHSRTIQSFMRSADKLNACINETLDFISRELIENETSKEDSV